MQRSQKVNGINILSFLQQTTGVTQEPPHIKPVADDAWCSSLFSLTARKGILLLLHGQWIYLNWTTLPVFLQQAYQQAVPNNNNWANEPVSCSMYFCPLCWVFCLSSLCFQPLFAANGLSDTGDRQSKTWKKYCLTTSVIANEAWLYEPKTNFTVMMDFYRFTDMMYVPTCRCSLHGNSK